MRYQRARPMIRSGDILAWSHRGIRSWRDLKIWFVRMFTSQVSPPLSTFDHGHHSNGNAICIRDISKRPYVRSNGEDISGLQFGRCIVFPGDIQLPIGFVALDAKVVQRGCDMSSGVAVSDVTYCSGAYTEFQRNSPGWAAISNDTLNVFGIKNHTLPRLGHLILSVLLIGSKKKVLWVYAQRVVTRMANAHPVRYISKFFPVGMPVRSFMVVGPYVEPSVPTIRGSTPKVTSIGVGRTCVKSKPLISGESSGGPHCASGILLLVVFVTKTKCIVLGVTKRTLSHSYSPLKSALLDVCGRTGNESIFSAAKPSHNGSLSYAV
jgi:hypothetical protein